MDRLNASWPDQQIEPVTAGEWFDELDRLDAGDVWLAIRELRTECKWRPSLAEILAGVKLYRAKLAEQVHHQHLQLTGRQQGVPMPPETKQAMEIVRDAAAGKLDRRQARQMCDTLATRLSERLEREQHLRLETG